MQSIALDEMIPPLKHNTNDEIENLEHKKNKLVLMKNNDIYSNASLFVNRDTPLSANNNKPSLYKKMTNNHGSIINSNTNTECNIQSSSSNNNQVSNIKNIQQSTNQIPNIPIMNSVGA